MCVTPPLVRTVLNEFFKVDRVSRAGDISESESSGYQVGYAGICVGQAKKPGPPRKKPRTRSELPPRRPLSMEEAAGRWRSRLALDTWLRQELGVDSELFPAVPTLAGRILVAYGRDLFHRQKTLRKFRWTILSVQDTFKQLRPFLGAAWDQVKVWEDEVPSALTVPMPSAIPKSMVITAVSWGWRRYACFLLHGFFGWHRGCELRALRRRDLVVPTRLLRRLGRKLFSRVNRPKNAWRGPRIQHSVIDVPSVVDYKLLEVGHLGSEELFFVFVFQSTPLQVPWCGRGGMRS